jgi:hypothetical protein
MRMTTKTNRRAPMINAGANDLEQALTQAEQVLAERDRHFESLKRTCQSIPALLARRQGYQADASDAAAGKIEAIQRQLAGQVRLRLASTDELLNMHAALETARQDLDSAREAYADQVVAEFTTRYNAAVAHLEQLGAEGAQLARSLRVPVDMPAAGVVVDPAPAAIPVPIDETAARIGSALDRLTEAVAFPKAFASIAERAATLERSGTAPAGFDAKATYTVAKAFTCSLTGVTFQPGMLIDSSLIPGPMLGRLYRSKYLRSDQISATAA